MVIVTPTVYDGDNPATLAAIKELGPDRARGVALVDEAAPPSVLDSLKEGGIAGVRLLLSAAAAMHREATAKRIEAAIDQVRRGNGISTSRRRQTRLRPSRRNSRRRPCRSSSTISPGLPAGWSSRASTPWRRS